MTIDPQSKIAGRPVLQIRDLMRKLRDHPFTAGDACAVLEVSDRTARRILSELTREGFLERTSHPHYSGTFWKTTLKGNSLALASAAKPITRATADRVVQAFMERVQQVNESDHYLYRVTKVVVFGSYLTDKERLGDVDIAVELHPKERDPKKKQDLDLARAQEAAKAGRHFSNFIAAWEWARNEVLLFLKSRSRTISLHETHDPILDEVETRTLFQTSSDDVR